MARWFALFVSALLALCAGNALAQAAYVHNLNGTATATVGDTQRPLKIGDLINSGTTVSTGDKSSAVIKFEDGQIMALPERSSFRIVEYRYNKQRVADSSAVFNLLRGGLRFISGVIGATNRNSFRMTAGTTTIGIRGTSGFVNYDPVTLSVLCAVAFGSVQMVTPQGDVVVGAGNFSSHVSGNPPTAPQPTAQATAAVQQVLAFAQALNVPINEPVVLTSSAAAAAAVAEARLLAARSAADPNNLALRQTAQDAAKQAEDAVFTAIQDARTAYEEALKGGATKSDPDPSSYTDDAAIREIIQILITPTPSGAAGSGGGGTSCGASCQ